MSPSETGQKIGYKKVNLAEYIGQGLRTQTFQMNDQGTIYLTVKILVIEAENDQDIA